MASQPIYYRNNGVRTYMPSLPSINSSNSGHYHGNVREMGPPTPPQPVEIKDLSMSRTLPSLMVPTSSSNLDLLPAPIQGYGEISYGNPNIAKIYEQFPSDGQIRVSTQDRMPDWGSMDAPWSHVPRVMPNVVPDGRFQSKQISSVNHVPSGGQYRSVIASSDAGSFHYGNSGAPHSDSGYGTHRSVANTSVISGDVPDRDQDCQSLASHVENYQPFNIGYNEDMQQRDARFGDPWNTVSNLPGSLALICPTCRTSVKTKSELKKHQNRHDKPFECNVPSCDRLEGFSTPNDLERHKKSKHSDVVIKSTSIKKYRCMYPGCRSVEKAWPRLDNFKSHLKRVHVHLNEKDIEDMVRQGQFLDQAAPLEDTPAEDHTLSDLVQRPTSFVPPDNTNRERTGTNWTPYPEAIEPAHDLIAPRGPQPGLYEQRPTNQDGRSLAENSPRIVKPGDVSLNYVPEVPLERVSVVSVDHDQLSAQPDEEESTAALKPSPQGRQNISAAAATAKLTQAIKTVLADLNTPGHRSGSTALQRNNLPNGRMSPRSKDPSVIHVSKAQEAQPADEEPDSNETSDAQAEKKAAEVLEILSNLGYTVSKDPTSSIRQHNIGSAASHKSDNQVTCKICEKFKGRPCELKKHMKRHDRPYGCTFPACTKQFGSKNDWKRHENSQHYHTETWRCTLPLPLSSPSSSTTCPKVCYRRQPFQEHLKRDHGISDEGEVKGMSERCKIGRNCQSRFWCGFCATVVELRRRGLEAWGERFDHIDDHFMGRGGKEVRRIESWVPLDGGKGEGGGIGGLGSSKGLEARETQGSGSSVESENSATVTTSLPSVGKAGESSANAINLDSPAVTKKRVAAPISESSTSTRATKRPKTASAYEKVVYCCECGSGHNPSLHPSCSTCDNSHRWCTNCKTKIEEVDPDVS